MNRSFDENLDKLRTRLIRMGSLVEEQVEFALTALNQGNAELARIVVERDDKVDKLDLKIDKQCQRIFALNQPVASDLRLLLAAIKINNELERIGDQAAEAAAIVLEVPGAVDLGRKVGLEPLTTKVHTMLKSSIDAFINNDTELAAHLLPADATVRDNRKEVQERIINAMKEDPALVGDGARLLIGTHVLGRIADHAANIAENVIFLVRAKLVRHRSVNDEALDFGDIIGSDATDDEGPEDGRS
jgi:phosphate transport system protein